MSLQFALPDPVDATDPSPDTVVDPHQVESLVNGFIAGKQAALFDAPAVVGQLNALRQATLDSVGDDATRAVLEPRLGAHLDDALDGISRHVETQREVFHRQTLSDRQGLIQRAATLEYDNDAKIAASPPRKQGPRSSSPI
jgi:hypothetical protein